MAETPDTLRALAEEMEGAHSARYTYAKEVRAHAATWEAERKRLEEAEKAIDDHDRRVIEDGHYCSVIGSSALAAGDTDG